MRSTGDLKLVAVAICVCATVAFGTWLLTGALNACFDDTKVRLMEMAKSNGCPEYWLNRYQSAWSGMLGAGATLAAAAIAWKAVQKQILNANRIPMEAEARQSRFNAGTLRIVAALGREILDLTPYEDGSGLRNVDIATKMLNREYVPLKPLDLQQFGEFAADYNLIAERTSIIARRAMMGRHPDMDEEVRLRLKQLEEILPRIENEITRLNDRASELDRAIARVS